MCYYNANQTDRQYRNKGIKQNEKYFYKASSAELPLRANVTLLFVRTEKPNI